MARLLQPGEQCHDEERIRMSRRIQCALPGYEPAWVALPDEWLGAHLARRDEAVRAASKYADGKITIAAISLCIVDDWGGIPGLEGRDARRGGTGEGLRGG